MNSGTLDQLLLKLCSSDNELRKSGESELEVFISNQPADLLVALSNIAVVHPNVIVNVIFILAKKFFEYSFKKVSNETSRRKCDIN
jgi:hypothetical protein